MELFSEKDLARIFQALAYAAGQHKDQRRKGGDQTPYINHPIEVAELLYRVGKVRDVNLLLAAILHDTVEDTSTTPEEIETLFGSQVRNLVMEVSDDKSLPKAERKRLQIVHAPHRSELAKQLKLADKICNIRDVIFHPPADWSDERRVEYIAWASAVVAGLRGANSNLEEEFDRVVAQAKPAIEKRDSE
ncbi:MAG: bifunctional (p)ppGpp synthetase/guanosine-3',5'-bis(diphosphate) 3'-pyrophosphohydrolase [Anaerolineaceae bacterium]|nr:bifunctional (p)ppGpp synthetase/guanosine-3',5'-bis(diphosphate) 3'-pyrophosphohydrolase [Anaerolineaceae bacterium]